MGKEEKVHGVAAYGVGGGQAGQCRVGVRCVGRASDQREQGKYEGRHFQSASNLVWLRISFNNVFTSNMFLVSHM